MKESKTTYATKQGKEIIKEIPGYYKYVQKVISLDPFEKAFLYNDYYTRMLALKYDFAVFDTLGREWNGETTNTELFNNIAICHLWKDQHIDTINEFFSEERIRIIDNGEDWEKHGRAQKIRVDMFGAFKWFSIFEDSPIRKQT